MKRTELKRGSVSLLRNRKPLPRKGKSNATKLKAKATALWGRYVHQRDVFCQVCGKGDGALHAHHIMVRSFNATRTDEGNGILACFRCHRYFLHGTDPMKAVAFYTQLLGVEGYAALRQKAYDGKDGRYGVDFWRAEAARLQGLIDEMEGKC